jgi:hypothetical protein
MIYFLQATDGGPIRIGYTDNPKTRFGAHGSSGRTILGVIPGDKATEKELHRRFGHARLGRGKDFDPVPELTEFIRAEARPFEELWGTACHEAGHAAVAVTRKLPLRHASIVPGADSLGHVLTAPPPRRFRPDLGQDARTARRVGHEVEFFLAGAAAETQLTGRDNHDGAAGDYHTAIGLADYLCGDGAMVQEYFDDMRAHTEGLVTYLRPAVEALAAELLEKCVITAKRVREICRQALRAAGRDATAAPGLPGPPGAAQGRPRPRPAPRPARRRRPGRGSA